MSGRSKRARRHRQRCVQHKHADQVPNDIDDIGSHRQIHGHAGLSHTAKKGSTGIIDRQSRIGISGNFKISNAGLHHIAFHFPNIRRSIPSLPISTSAETNVEKLRRTAGAGLARFPGSIYCLSANILADHHCATGCQCRKQVNKNRVKLVYQRNTGNRRFPGIADHQMRRLVLCCDMLHGYGVLFIFCFRESL